MPDIALRCQQILANALRNVMIRLRYGARTLLSATDDASSVVHGRGASLAGGTGDADKSVQAPILSK